jgi:hypothetical protein
LQESLKTPLFKQALVFNETQNTTIITVQSIRKGRYDHSLLKLGSPENIQYNDEIIGSSLDSYLTNVQQTKEDA